MADFSLSADIVEQVRAAAKLQAATGDYDYIVFSGHTQDTTYIMPMNPGTLNVYYQYYDVPAQIICIAREQGGADPVKVGENTFELGEGDMLAYALSSPTNAIKVGLGFSRSLSS